MPRDEIDRELDEVERLMLEDGLDAGEALAAVRAAEARKREEALREEIMRLREENARTRIRVTGPMIFWAVVLWTIIVPILGSVAVERSRPNFVECLEHGDSRASCEAAQAAWSPTLLVGMFAAVWLFGLVLAYVGWKDIRGSPSRSA